MRVETLSGDGFFRSTSAYLYLERMRSVMIQYTWQPLIPECMPHGLYFNSSFLLNHNLLSCYKASTLACL